MAMSDPLSVLRRIATTPRPEPSPYERCEMCSAPVADEHQHVVDVEARSLMCCCRPCYLLFDRPGAALRYRAVPDRYLRFDDLALSPASWDGLQIPVGLAFFFRNSTLGKTVAFYPGPAGATESELGLDAWHSVVAANPQLGTLADDVEAILVRAENRGTPAECFLVPIDACYELVGTLRRLWRGFDGGQEARTHIEDFFARLRARSRPAGLAQS
ncbi:MAG: DUF5947 family protein [bacterium]